jgi:hypothetical protein
MIEEQAHGFGQFTAVLPLTVHIERPYEVATSVIAGLFQSQQAAFLICRPTR